MKNLLVALTVLLLFSCSNDSNNNNTPNQNVRLRLIKVETSDGRFSNFIYDENDLLIEENTDENRKTTYQYLNGLTSSKTVNNKISSTYTHTGNLITTEYFNPSNVNDKIVYKYNSEGKIIEEILYSGGKVFPTATFEYDIKGNMVKIIESDGIIETYDYDNNPSITNTFFPKDLIKLGWGGCSVNNRIRVTASYGKVTTYNYTYNEYGYPKTMMVNDGISSITRTFTYETY